MTFMRKHMVHHLDPFIWFSKIAHKHFVVAFMSLMIFKFYKTFTGCTNASFGAVCLNKVPDYSLKSG